MSEFRSFQDNANRSSEQVDSFLDDLAPDQPATSAPDLDDIDADIVTGREPNADSGSEQSSGSATGAMDKGQEAMSAAKDKASGMASQAQARADEGVAKAAGGMSQAAEALRQRGEEQSGAMGTAAATAADTLESASSYLKDKDTDQLLQDIEALIRRKPVESLLVAVGAGFVLSKILG